MKRMIVIALVSLMASCSKSPKEIKLPKNLDEVQDVQTYIEKNLEGEDRQLANQFIDSMSFPSTFSTANYTNMTLADGMLQQKKINNMNDAVEVVYVEHQPYSKTGLPMKGYDFKIKFHNKQTKPIIGIKGSLIFIDVFGKKSGLIKIEHSEILQKDTEVYKQVKIFPLGGEEYFNDGNYSADDVLFKPKVVVFQDKSSISIAE